MPDLDNLYTIPRNSLADMLSADMEVIGVNAQNEFWMPHNPGPSQKEAYLTMVGRGATPEEAITQFIQLFLAERTGNGYKIEGEAPVRKKRIAWRIFPELRYNPDTEDYDVPPEMRWSIYSRFIMLE